MDNLFSRLRLLYKGKELEANEMMPTNDESKLTH